MLIRLILLSYNLPTILHGLWILGRKYERIYFHLGSGGWIVRSLNNLLHPRRWIECTHRFMPVNQLYNVASWKGRLYHPDNTLWLTYKRPQRLSSRGFRISLLCLLPRSSMDSLHESCLHLGLRLVLFCFLAHCFHVGFPFFDALSQELISICLLQTLKFQKALNG